MSGENTVEKLAASGFLKVKVKTNAKETRVRSVEGGVVFVDVKAQPIDGRANTEIIKFLSRLLKKKVTLKSGAASKVKLFRIE